MPRATSHRVLPRLLGASALVVLGGCVQPASWHAEDADVEADRILAEAEVEVADRDLIHPKPGAAPVLDASFTGLEPRRLTLDDALDVAVRRSRDYQSRRESLLQAGLSLGETRFGFGPQLSSAVTYGWSDHEDGEGAQQVGVTGAVSQVLPLGGVATLSAGLSAAYPEGGTAQTFASSLGLSVTQPLLRGAGWDVSHEALTQAERSLLYALREFQLFEQDFAIGIAQSYYGLVSQQETLANQQRTYDEAVYDRKKAEALRQVDRNTDEQVFRARRREVVTQAGLMDAQTAYRRGLDELKIELGLPTSANLDVVPAEPPYEAVRLDADSAVAAALHNRFEVETARQQLEDAERRVGLAEDGLLPELGLTLDGSLQGQADRLPRGMADDWSFSGGLTLGLPLQLESERNAYRAALIQRDRAARALDLLLDRIGLEVRNQLYRLQSVEQQIELQEAQIAQEQRAVTVTQVRYDADQLDNRDLLEARQGLIDAQNALIRLKVDHYVMRLRLVRDLGLPTLDAQGRLR